MIFITLPSGMTMREYVACELDKLHKVTVEPDELHGKKVTDELEGLHGKKVTDELEGLHSNKGESGTALTESVGTSSRDVDQSTSGRPARERRLPSYLKDYQ